MPNLRLSKLNLFSPFPPSSKLIHLAYISVTACQCGSFCPRPVLGLSIDCSILLKSSLAFPLYRSHCSSVSLYLSSCMQNTQHYSCCALTHTALSSIFLPEACKCSSFFFFLLVFFVSSLYPHVRTRSAFPFVPGTKMTRLNPAETDGGADR